MATVYTPANPALPNSSDAGTSVPSDAKNNAKALMEYIAMGSIPGAMSIVVGSGTAAQPDQYLWTMAGILRVRATNVWGSAGGATGNLSSQLYEISEDSGASWATVCTKAFTYDASGNCTATSGAGSMLDFLWPLVGRVASAIATLLAHIGGIGAAVHGLGSIAVQSAASVALTGGFASLTFFRSKKLTLGAISASTELNWQAAGFFTVTVAGASAVFTHTGLPNGTLGDVILKVTNGGLATNLFAGCQAPGGVKPVLKTAGVDYVQLLCDDGATIVVSGPLADVKPF